MELKTFSAASVQEALQMVRRELGPDAAVLYTREVRGRTLFGLLPGSRQFEVTASLDDRLPGRLGGPARKRVAAKSPTARPSAAQVSGGPERAVVSRMMAPIVVSPQTPDQDAITRRERKPAFPPVEPPIPPVPRDAAGDELVGLALLAEQLRVKTPRSSGTLPPELFGLFTHLIEADVAEDQARVLLQRVCDYLPAIQTADEKVVRELTVRAIQERIAVAGPIQAVGGKRRVAALVGPTGVGKTTTIAKLAAHFRIREKRKVGLITVDTYRIAAVDQLRTYADIIDLPLEVVSTPRDVRPALERLRQQELVLIDTAGRSSHDAVRIQELKAVLTEAEPDEVHLVLSTVAGGHQLRRTADQFAEVGITSLLLTKLDEASTLGHLLSILDNTCPPLSYVTDGQNVPDDIETVEADKLARRILNW